MCLSAQWLGDEIIGCDPSSVKNVKRSGTFRSAPPLTWGHVCLASGLPNVSDEISLMFVFTFQTVPPMAATVKS